MRPSAASASRSWREDDERAGRIHLNPLELRRGARLRDHGADFDLLGRKLAAERGQLPEMPAGVGMHVAHGIAEASELLRDRLTPLRASASELEWRARFAEIAGTPGFSPAGLGAFLARGIAVFPSRIRRDRDKPYPGVVLARTELNHVRGYSHTLKASKIAGEKHQAAARRQLERMYDPRKYKVVENHALRNIYGEKIRINGKTRRPDFQIINKASGRITAVYEAKTGSITYLSGPGQRALFAYRQGAARLGYKAPPVEAIYKVRTGRVVRLSVGASAVTALSVVSLGLSIWLDDRDNKKLDAQLRWLREHDPVYYKQLVFEIRCRKYPNSCG